MRGTAVRQALLRIVAVQGLLVLLVALIIAFSVLRPHTFPTIFNFQSILSDKSIIALLALGVMVPLAANQFDLSIGYLAGLSHILAMGFQRQLGIPWFLAVPLVVALGAAVGIVNGLLVTRARISSFIATLGTGTFIYGISNLYTGGAQVTGALPDAFVNISSAPLGIPLPAVYVVVLGIALWIVLEYRPLGRYLYVLGANPRAALLTGIPERVYVPLSFAIFRSHCVICGGRAGIAPRSGPGLGGTGNDASSFCSRPPRFDLGPTRSGQCLGHRDCGARACCRGSGPSPDGRPILHRANVQRSDARSGSGSCRICGAQKGQRHQQEERRVVKAWQKVMRGV